MKNAGLVLVAVLLAGCGDVGVAEMSQDADSRGSVGGNGVVSQPGTGGAGGSGGQLAAAGGASGAGGARAGMGGATGSGGAGAGGMTGAGGAAGSPVLVTCSVVVTSATPCDKLNADGSISYRMKDGYRCALCSPFPTQTPCLSSVFAGLCVRMCGECL
jgi:hypothetical protein